ncbi:MAG TPA: AmmeMemoRadiSam system protein B [Albitalea sp.]|uniref:AmmeMemoRadiSam system protein B n=1 Tax=Piscinibacter sp. TaxID=1903157 RepID=UPI002ED4AD59
MDATAVRPAAVAGMFYPADPAALRAQLDALLSVAGASADKAPKLLVVPHAGYVYSGPIAARAYATLAPWREQITRVVMLGPAHRVPVASLAAPAAGAFETPLGRVEIDAQALQKVADLRQVVRDDRPHAFEHSLEVQLPFLQVTLAHFTLAPLVVGAAHADAVAQVLERLWGGDETLIVISSDLSHYLAHAQAQARDRRTIARMVAFDAALEPDDACGAHAINGALVAARRHGLAPRVLDVRNSGDTAGDRRGVVGYAAVAFS